MQKLVIWNARMSDKGIENISLACKNLQVLDLWNSNKVTDAGIEFIALNCSQLKELNLSHCLNIGPASLYSIANYCSNLKILSLDKSGNKVRSHFPRLIISRK